MNDRHVDIASSSLSGDAFTAASHGLLALARQNDSKLVAEIVLEVYQACVRVDVLCAWLFEYSLCLHLISLPISATKSSWTLSLE